MTPEVDNDEGTLSPEQVRVWLESDEGEAWSCDRHYDPVATSGSHHFASIKPLFDPMARATMGFSHVGDADNWGDPLFSANAIQPRDNYKVLIDHYRAEYDRHGHDPCYAYVAAGAGFLFLADTTQQAKQHYGPIYEKMVEFFNWPGNHTPGNEMTFRDIDHAVAEGPVLAGSPQQIIDKILYFHQAFGHDLQSFSLPTMLPHEQQVEMLERLATEVIPAVRREAPTTLWTDRDPYGRRPAFTGRQVPDAAAVIDSWTADHVTADV